MATAGAVAASVFGVPDLTFTPKSEKQVANIDVARAQIKNYYGAPRAKAGARRRRTGAGLDVAAEPAQQLRPRGAQGRPEGRRLAVVAPACAPPRDRARRRRHDIDHEELRTLQQLGLQPGHERRLRRPDAAHFTGNMFPATPGMLHLVRRAKALGYAVFFVTGRGDAQHQATVANLVNDAAAALPDITSVTFSGGTIPEVDAGYPPATPLDTGQAASPTASSPSRRSARTRPT